MVARTTDFVRETSAMLKRPEVLQDYLAVKEKINDAEEQSKVTKTAETETELEKLRPDEGGGDGGGYGGSHEYSGKKEDETDDDLLVPAGDSVIDIRV